jgi:hypothetical protein
MIPLPSPSTQREPSADEKMGMAWWNNMNSRERRAALDAAAAKLGGDPSVADAWAAWKSSAFTSRLESDPISAIAESNAPARSYSQSPLPTGSNPSGKARLPVAGDLMNNSCLHLLPPPHPFPLAHNNRDPMTQPSFSKWRYLK